MPPFIKSTEPAFGAPFKPYGENVPNIEAIQYRNKDHIPDNKRQGEVESILTITAKRYINGENIELGFEEITTTGGQYHGDKPKRVACRTISTTMPLPQAVKLARFILEAVAMQANNNQADLAINTFFDLIGMPVQP